MDKVIKAIASKKKVVTNTTINKEINTTNESSNHADYINGYLLAHLDPQCNSTVLKEKKLVGNAWSGLIGETLEINTNTKSKAKYNLGPSVRMVMANSSPFLSDSQTPSPVSPRFVKKNDFQAKAPSPTRRSPKRK